jgi:hypothetical protein
LSHAAATINFSNDQGDDINAAATINFSDDQGDDINAAATINFSNDQGDDINAAATINFSDDQGDDISLSSEQSVGRKGSFSDGDDSKHPTYKAPESEDDGLYYSDDEVLDAEFERGLDEVARAIEYADPKKINH